MQLKMILCIKKAAFHGFISNKTADEIIETLLLLKE